MTAIVTEYRTPDDIDESSAIRMKAETFSGCFVDTGFPRDVWIEMLESFFDELNSKQKISEDDVQSSRGLFINLIAALQQFHELDIFETIARARQAQVHADFQSEDMASSLAADEYLSVSSMELSLDAIPEAFHGNDPHIPRDLHTIELLARRLFGDLREAWIAVVGDRIQQLADKVNKEEQLSDEKKVNFQREFIDYASLLQNLDGHNIFGAIIKERKAQANSQSVSEDARNEIRNLALFFLDPVYLENSELKLPDLPEYFHAFELLAQKLFGNLGEAWVATEISKVKKSIHEQMLQTQIQAEFTPSATAVHKGDYTAELIEQV